MVCVGFWLGGVFFGESMFTRISNASKVALVYLVRMLQRAGFELIDCQVTTAHLMRFGAQEIPRGQFLKELEQALKKPTMRGRWSISETREVVCAPSNLGMGAFGREQKKR